MSTIAIRDAVPSDLSRITGIYADAVTNGTASYELDPPSLAEMRARFESLKAGGFPYLAAVDETDTVLGYAYAGVFRPRPAYRFIVEDSVYVAPEAKGRGVGRLLMEHLIEAVRTLGFRQIVAVIGDGRADSASVKLHERLRFTHSGQLTGSGYKHGRWLDTAFMQLELNGGATLPPDPDSWPERAFRAK
ncbi:MAG: N-acetyltransferase [Mesorhizobium sp.]|nr:GNAT family N-acetyltransferase [Mesorhizobium sp.]MBN9242640.1 N-acetyltransferase [Mesorhizobium sp.]MBN9270455.1 N-acetyltransferase [Mesorhizobium sp.]